MISTSVKIIKKIWNFGAGSKEHGAWGMELRAEG